MKRFFLIFLPILVLLGAAYLFREPIIDFLPIDQSGWSSNVYGTCYLDEDGDAVSGWQTIDGNTYYFAPETAALHTGWADRNGVPCYVSEGLPLSGWVELEGRRLYLNSDGSIHTGWLSESDGKRYLDQDGTAVSGWADTEDGRFYFDDSGLLCTGLVRIEETLYCFGPDGRPHKGWFQQGSRRYYATEDGSVHTGWLELDGKRYYLLPDGTAAAGKLEIDGKIYYFSSTGLNFILVNPWNKLPEDFEPELVLFENNWIAAECQQDLALMLADCRAAGHRPRIMSGHRSLELQAYTLNRAIAARMELGYTYEEASYLAVKAVAIPGTSEHHLGLALDIVDATNPRLEEFQEDMPTQQWLMENCWKYGFIMRYPKEDTEITGIIYEPWHYRYVGREMAQEIHEMDVCLEVYIDLLTGDGTTCGGTVATAE